MELKPGYKQTEVGAIPEEWEVARLGAACEIFGRIGFRGYTKNDIVEQGQGAIAISPSNIRDNKTDFTSCTYVSWPKYEESPEIKIYNGDVLLVKTGSTFGKTAIVQNLTDKATLNPQVVVLKKAKIDNFFLGYMMSFETIQSQISSAIVGGALPTLSQKLVAQFRLPLPATKTEQEAIAGALSDVDALIGALDSALAKKRDLKQAAMQQLLTGQKRLLGFHGEWEVKRLGELAEIISGGTPKTSEPSYWNGAIKWCTPTEITGCSGKYLIETERTISTDGLASCSAQLLPVGSLLLCSRATIGEVRIAGCEICTNQGFKCLVCKPGVSNEFLYYKLMTMRAQMVERAIGSTFLEISKKDTVALQLSVPEHGEQTAIAEVLSDMDAELAALEQRRDKTRALKQGMMQELLTGRTRLV